VANYGYLNARVRGLRTRLLQPGFVDQVLAGGGFETFVNALAQTTYARDLETARGLAPGEPVSLTAVDRAIASHFQRVTSDLLRHADGEARTLVGLLLRRYDVANLKAVARAFHAGKAGAERDDAQEAVLSATLPAGELDAGTLRTMAGASDLPAAAQALVVAGHPLAAEFRAAVADYAKDHDLLALELRLDLAHHASVLAEAREAGAPDAFLHYLELEIDATNLLTAVKLRGRDVDAAACFVPGGRRLSRAQFLALASSPPDAPLPEVRGPFAGLPAHEGELEGWLRAAIERAARTLTADPLDIGLVTHYLRAKERETAMLRLLARGTFYGVPAATLKRELGHA
jgi:V/A-type H+/Na+-transporting ATPase subunit C